MMALCYVALLLQVWSLKNSFIARCIWNSLVNCLLLSIQWIQNILRSFILLWIAFSSTLEVNLTTKFLLLFVILVMEEDLTLISTLRKIKLNDCEGYLRRCPAFVSAGYVAACVMPCKICDGSRRLTELLAFFARRDRMDRPERECSSF